jgi:hypothetical protein
VQPPGRRRAELRLRRERLPSASAANTKSRAMIAQANTFLTGFPRSASAAIGAEGLYQVRHALIADQMAHRSETTLCARNEHFGDMERAYSIISSVSTSMVGGIVNPSARAVLRLTISSNLVGS